MIELSDVQVRVLGCLMEKKETTPDQYPLTLNALRNACNQKSSRDPVMDLNEGDVGHALRELEGMDLAGEVWGSRVARWEHKVPQALGLHSKGIALLSTLMLRGPQTLGELRTHCHRMYEFDDLDDVQYALQKLAEGGKVHWQVVTNVAIAPHDKKMHEITFGQKRDIPDELMQAVFNRVEKAKEEGTLNDEWSYMDQLDEREKAHDVPF